MIIVKLMGGLGNQMFQYAFAKSQSLKRNQPFKLDTKSFQWDKLRDFELNVFSLDKKIATDLEIERARSSKRSFLLKLLKRKQDSILTSVFLESSLNFDKKASESSLLYFEGYWQSEKYFSMYENEIRTDFLMKIAPNEYYTKILAHVKQSLSVSVHFRRGDFVSDAGTNEFHGLCDLDYYKRAILYIEKQYPSVTFFMISDDITWVKNEFGYAENIVFVENNQGPDFEDMRLMSQCKHNIIANSSFSWWGAWLNENKNKTVIAPERWYGNKNSQEQTSDLIPQSWIRL